MAEKQVSAGGVLIKEEGGVIYVLLGLTNYPRGRWTLPKGIIQEGETLEQTAVREVAEETGVVGNIERKLGETQYTFCHQGREIEKLVIYYLMKVKDTLPYRDQEMKDVRWVPLDKAIAMVPFQNEKDILLAVKAG